MQLPKGSVDEDRKARLEKVAQVGHGDGRRKNSKTGEDGGYHTAQVGLETEEERRAEAKPQENAEARAKMPVGVTTITQHGWGPIHCYSNSRGEMSWQYIFTGHLPGLFQTLKWH